MIYKFTVLGHPISKSNFKPRSRGAYFGDHWKKLCAYNDSIRKQVAEQMKSNGWEKFDGSFPIQMLIVIYKKRNAGDTQNYDKTILDALGKRKEMPGILYDDDKIVKLIATFEGGIDKENPRIDILAAPLEKFDILQVGTLAYSTSKSVNIFKEIKKTEKAISWQCPKCNGLLIEKKGYIGKTSVNVLTCNKCDYAEGLK